MEDEQEQMSILEDNLHCIREQMNEVEVTDEAYEHLYQEELNILMNMELLKKKEIMWNNGDIQSDFIYKGGVPRLEPKEGSVKPITKKEKQKRKAKRRVSKQSKKK